MRSRVDNLILFSANMRKINILPVAVIFLLFTTACARQTQVNGKTISIEQALDNIQEICLSKYATKIEYVLLDNSDSIMLPGVKDLQIKGAGDNLFISHGVFSLKKEACFRFTSDGKFCNTIGIRGRGPGEFTRLRKVYVDPVKHTFIISDPNKLITYSYDGQFLTEKAISDFTPEESARYNIGAKEFLYMDYKETVLITNDNDTLKNMDGSTRYILEYGRYAPDSKGKKITIPSSKYVETEHFVKFNAIRTAFAFPNLDEHEKIAEIIYDKKAKRTYSIKIDYNQPFEGFKNDLDGGIPFWPVYASEGKMYQMLDATDFISYAQKSNSAKMKEAAAKLTEDSNPVLIVATLK